MPSAPDGTAPAHRIFSPDTDELHQVLPVTFFAESAAPPRESPSIFVMMMPSMPSAVVKALCRIDRILTGQRIDNQKNLMRFDRLFESEPAPPSVLHRSASRPAVSTIRTLQPLRSASFIAAESDLLRLPACPRIGEHRCIDRLSDDFQLVDRRRSDRYRRRTASVSCRFS